MAPWVKVAVQTQGSEFKAPAAMKSQACCHSYITTVLGGYR